jgi:hypothetical protein
VTIEPSIAAAAGFAFVSDLVTELSPYQLFPDPTLGKHELIMIGPTVATNLLSTGLIAWKAWCASPASDPQQ